MVHNNQLKASNRPAGNESYRSYQQSRDDKWDGAGVGAQ